MFFKGYGILYFIAKLLLLILLDFRFKKFQNERSGTSKPPVDIEQRVTHS